MSPIRMGVVGCGAIAQVHHMPNLLELQDEFEVTAVCDVSPGAAAYVAKRFRVPHHFTDYRDLLAADVDAVLLCQSDPKTDVAVAAFDAGKHVFIEKPVCFSLQEMERMVAAQKRSGKVGQAGYMKVFDPAFEIAKAEAEDMDVTFVQINHLHPNNNLHTAQFDIRRFDDIPSSAIEATNAARTAARTQAIGEVPPAVERAFHMLSGSMIHDLYGLRTVMGLPTEIVSTEIWLDGRAFTTTLAYANGARCVATWIDLPELWDFQESLEIYGGNKRVILEYPTGFSKGHISKITIQGIDEVGVTYRKQPAIDWDSAFVREMRHFHSCITEGTACRTPLSDAGLDVGLIIDIVKAYLGK
ncbi:MAG: Gfo/Idh/MocA family oxidoreductase [Caldilineaceae bacterium]